MTFTVVLLQLYTTAPALSLGLLLDTLLRVGGIDDEDRGRSGNEVMKNCMKQFHVIIEDTARPMSTKRSGSPGVDDPDVEVTGLNADWADDPRLLGLLGDVAAKEFNMQKGFASRESTSQRTTCSDAEGRHEK